MARNNSLTAHFVDELLLSGTVPLVQKRSSFTADAPLLVFLPGSNMTARPAYGPSGSKPEDFLEHWLSEYGYIVLSLSHPLITEGMPDDEYTPGMLADTRANTIASIITQENLPESIIVLGWQLQAAELSLLQQSLRHHKVNIKLFISLSSPWLSSDGPDTEDGWNDIAEINSRYSRDVLTQQQYKMMTGASLRQPLLLSADYQHMPLTAALVPSGHKLLESAEQKIWSGVILRMFHYRVVAPAQLKSGPLKAAKMKRVERLIHSVPERLILSIEGNQHFFIGEHGAHETADKIRFLDEETDTLLSELDDLFDEHLS